MSLTEPGRARGLVDKARASEQRGECARSHGLYDDAIAILERDQDVSMLADTLRWKGTLHREQGETEAAYRCYKQSLAHADRCGSLAARAHGYNCLAIVAQRRGNLTESERMYTEAAAIASKAGEVRLLGMIEQNRGVLMNM